MKKVEIEKDELRALLSASSFSPSGPLSSAHVQTVYQSLFRREGALALSLQKVEADDGEELEVYLSEEFESSTSPVVLIAHGLEGNHLSPYVRGLQKYLRDRGWGSAALVHRSCGGVLNERQQIYHSGETGDLAAVVAYLGQRYAQRPLFVAGYSLGGNQVAKWFGEAGEGLPSRVIAGASISPPFDLSVTAGRIDQALWGIYRRNFLKTLRPKAAQKQLRYPELLSRERIAEVRTIRHFDDALTAPLHGFLDGEDYYQKVGWLQFSESIRRSLFVLASRDDPFSPVSSIPPDLGEGHPWLSCQITDKGGHVGFIGGSFFRPAYWSEQQIYQFFEFHRARLG